MKKDVDEALVQSVVHTPGPWRLDTWNGWLLSAEDVGMVKFDIIVKFDMNRTILADAKLMAAAPEMFEVVKRFATIDWMGEAELNM
ncbi:MAG: hypothetical protein ACK5S6_00125, partial [bacterium]